MDIVMRFSSSFAQWSWWHLYFYGYVWGGPTALKGMLCKLCPQAPELGPLYPIVDGGLRPVCRPHSTVFSLVVFFVVVTFLLC